MALRSEDTTIFDIAAGTGMFSTAIELACAAVGVRSRTIGYCERDACAAACLVARMEGKTLAPAPIWDDVGTLDCEPWRGQVDIFCAGYPCQPFSSAGKQIADRDPRYLWPAICRAIAGIEPSIVFLENVEGHVGKGAGKVLRDLLELGYRVTAGLFSSNEVGAPHQRKRLFILGMADTESGDGCLHPRSRGQGTRATKPDRKDRAMAQSYGEGLERTGAGGSEAEESVLTGEGRELANAKCDRQSGYERDSRSCGEPHPANGGGDMGHANGDGGKSRDISKGKQGRKATGAGCGELSRYPPPRDDYRSWATVASVDPTRMPSIESSLRCVAAGLAGWSDEIRLVGNGVDPLVAAYAFLSLAACLL